MSNYIGTTLSRTLTSALVPSMPVRVSTTASTPVPADLLSRQTHALMARHDVAAWPPVAGVPAQFDAQPVSKRRSGVNRAAATAYGFRAWSPPF